MNTLV